MSCNGEERGTSGTPHSITSTSSSSSGFANINFTQEVLDEVSRQKKSLNKHKLEQSKNGNEHHLTLLNLVLDSPLKGMK